MPVPIVCLDDEVRHFAERFGGLFPFSSSKLCLLLLPQPPPALLLWAVRLRRGTYATGGPSSCDEMDRTIGGHRERGTNALSQDTASLL